MMKAWTITKANSKLRNVNLPSDSLVLQNVPIPTIENDNEVLVKLKASSINFNAVWSCMREPMDPFALIAGHVKRNPHDNHHNIDYCIPGSDGSGVVIQVGSGVTEFVPGDEVVIHCAVISDNDLTMCDSMLSKTQSIWGYETNYGAFAEYALVKKSQLIKKPSSLDFLTAGSCLLTLGTAYRMLISENGAQVKKGELCLIWGASGGLGVFAIQLCLSIGAIPVCIVSDEDKASFCRAVGAEKIIICERKEQDNFVDSSGKPNYVNWRRFEKKLIEVTGSSRVDCVFEHIGRNVFALSIFMLRRGGRLVTCAATTGYDAQVDIRFIWMEMKRIIGSHFCNSQEANNALDLLSSGSIYHKFEEVISFDQIPMSIDKLFLRNSKGKIVVQY